MLYNLKMNEKKYNINDKASLISKNLDEYSRCLIIIMITTKTKNRSCVFVLIVVL